jgi:hypothetical protein
MTVLTLRPQRSSHERLSATDDAQRMLLCCILRDAGEFHFAAIGECPGCRAFLQPGGPCDDCWDTRRPAYTAYHHLADELDSYEAYPMGRRTRSAARTAW